MGGLCLHREERLFRTWSGRSEAGCRSAFCCLLGFCHVWPFMWTVSSACLSLARVYLDFECFFFARVRFSRHLLRSRERRPFAFFLGSGRLQISAAQPNRFRASLQVHKVWTPRGPL